MAKITFKKEQFGEGGKIFLSRKIWANGYATIGSYDTEEEADAAARAYQYAEDNHVTMDKEFQVKTIDTNIQATAEGFKPKKYIKIPTWLCAAIVVAMAVGLLFVSKADAANMMMNQAVQNTILLSTMDNGPSKRPEPQQQAPQRPATLYRERVPGKPEEGFVPVTPAPTAPPRYVQERINVYGVPVEMLDDKAKGVKCFVYKYGGRPSISCVKY
jgi:hypothetical protein